MIIDTKTAVVCLALLFFAWHTGRAVNRVLGNPGSEPRHLVHDLALSRLSTRYIGLLLLYGYFMTNQQPNWSWSTHGYILGSSFVLLLTGSWWPTTLPTKETLQPQPKPEEPKPETWTQRKIGRWEQPAVEIDEHGTHFR